MSVHDGVVLCRLHYHHALTGPSEGGGLRSSGLSAAQALALPLPGLPLGMQRTGALPGIIRMRVGLWGWGAVGLWACGCNLQ